MLGIITSHRSLVCSYVYSRPSTVDTFPNVQVCDATAAAINATAGITKMALSYNFVELVR